MIECLTGEYLRALNTMGDSSSPLIDYIFQVCVVILQDIAQALGTSYEAVNIWIFVIIWPTLTIAMLLWIIKLTLNLRKLKRITS